MPEQKNSADPYITGKLTESFCIHTIVLYAGTWDSKKNVNKYNYISWLSWDLEQYVKVINFKKIDLKNKQNSIFFCFFKILNALVLSPKGINFHFNSHYDSPAIW